MFRVTTKTLLLGALATALLAGPMAGCGGGGEERRIVRNYFTASRVNDRATLGNIAMVEFNPRDDGVVIDFDVVSVSEEMRRPLEFKRLTAALRAARAAEQEFTERKKTYQDANFDAITRVLEAERANKPVAARDRKVQEEWTTWREETMAHAKKVSDAQAALAAEAGVVELSVSDPSTPRDVTQFDGELITKAVTVDARVQKEGQTEERQMVLRLQQAMLTGGEGEPIEGRWVITSISRAST